MVSKARKPKQRTMSEQAEAAKIEALLIQHRGIRGPLCEKCHGWGRFYYSNTGTWTNAAIVGHGFTWGTCDACWGSGEKGRPGVDLLAFEAMKAARYEQGRREALRAIRARAVAFAKFEHRAENAATKSVSVARSDAITDFLNDIADELEYPSPRPR